MADAIEDTSSAGGFYGWKNVGLLFVAYAVTMGFIFYGFTVIFPSMIEAEGWQRGEASLAHTLRGVFVGLMAPLTALSVGKLGARRTLRIGFAVGAVALWLLGTVTTQLWQWIAIWGVLMPVAFAMGGLIPIQTVVSFWFSVRRATAMGVVMTGAAAAGFMAAPLYTYIIDQVGTWRAGWLVAAGCCCIGLLVTFFIENAPGDLGQHPDGIDPDQKSAAANAASSAANGPHKTTEVWTLREALRTRVVWLQMVCLVGQAWALYMVTVHGVLHLVDKDFSRMEAASVIGNLILFSGLARFPTGLLADRVEPRILSTAALVGMALALLGFWQAPASMTAVLASAATYGFCFGVTVITFPMITANYFGPAVFAPITGFFMPFIIALGAPVPFVAGLIFDHYGSYDWAFIPVVAMVCVAALCAWFLYPPRKADSPQPGT
jgi:MFS family permease